MLQSRINELDSAILDIKQDKVYVLGFSREEMLQKFIEGSKCWRSQGLYDYQDLEFHNIKTDALIIVRKNGEEINRYQYKQVHKDIIKSKNEEGKNISFTFTIRKNTYSDQYHFLTEKSSQLFDNKNELDQYLLDEFGIEWGI